MSFVPFVNIISTGSIASSNNIPFNLNDKSSFIQKSINIFDSLSNNYKSPLTRVNQLDATLLDQEIFNSLFEKTLSIFNNNFYPVLKLNYSNELKLFLKSILFKFTIWDNSTTYGFFLQNLKLIVNNSKENKNLQKTTQNSRKLTKKIKILYYIFFILFEYLHEKIEFYMYSMDDDEDEDGDGDGDEDYYHENHETENVDDYEFDSNKNRKRKQSLFKNIIKKLLRFFKPIFMVFTNFYKILNLFIFCKFLIDGKFQSLNYYLLNISTNINSIEFDKKNKGNVSFEYQNRQLIWNTFIEFLIFFLPIIQKNNNSKNKILKNLRKQNKIFFKNSKIGKFISKNYLNQGNYDGGHSESRNLKKLTNIQLFNHLNQSQCAICYQNTNNFNNLNSSNSNTNSLIGNDGNVNLITNPYITNCGHIYCYMCLLTKLERFQSDERNLDNLKKIHDHSHVISHNTDDDDDDDYDDDNDERWRCLRCYKQVLWCKPYEDINPDAIIGINLDDLVEIEQPKEEPHDDPGSYSEFSDHDSESDEVDNHTHNDIENDSDDESFDQIPRGRSLSDSETENNNETGDHSDNTSSGDEEDYGYSDSDNGDGGNSGFFSDDESHGFLQRNLTNEDELMEYEEDFDQDELQL
ncbi:uncharacterized protein ASCRUDRAFT_72522 [Ascoidea rubescens DSM 1968]|uniref:RING-type domain-containing protein n=1 Tax=Ascoidea rubescens DSM 1968 TaxID=1344418 RepID=A0A1D2VAB5_9ASCO|nr:hypothetical protein ASCRUDRAFT_72522 [Ascoidea rubescens DSM 1968]ODV58594.1 hypothetical protein ASCRUDRAFT_72522 [Ascoidea rubescens DSM 1968]